MSRRVASVSRKRKRVGHWASDFVKGADLLAYTVSTGSSRYLQHVLPKRGLISQPNSKPLLQFAIPSWSVMASRKDDAINFDVAIILLFRGENPLDEYEGRNAWRDAFTWITDDPSAIKSSFIIPILTIIRVMIDFPIDLNKRRAGLDKGRTPAGVIRRFVLEAICCSDARTETCVCTTALNLRRLANSILRKLESRNETPHTYGRPQDRGRRPQSRGREPLPKEAARMPLGPQTHKHDRSMSRSYKRSTSIQSMFRSTDHNADRPQLSRYDEPSPAKRFDTSETASASRGIRYGTGTYRAQHQNTTEQEHSSKFRSASEPYPHSSKAPVNTRSGPQPDNTRVNGVSSNVHSTALPDRSRSAYPIMQDRNIPARRRESHGSIRPVRPSVGNYSGPPSSSARSETSSSDMHAPNLMYALNLGNPPLPHQKRRRRRSFWHRFKQLFTSSPRF